MTLTIEIERDPDVPREGRMSLFRVGLPGAGVPDFGIRARGARGAADALKWFIYDELDGKDTLNADE